ncbi:MAG: hypothetical protein J6O04_12655 [Selenomonadaceae bacterium]|nr:hypothetical protein [Selenomonadaceae bacterium]
MMKNVILFVTLIIAGVLTLTSNLAYANSNSNSNDIVSWESTKRIYAAIYSGSPESMVKKMNSKLPVDGRIKITHTAKQQAVTMYHDGKQDFFLGYEVAWGTFGDGHKIQFIYYDNIIYQINMIINPNTSKFPPVAKVALLSIGVSESNAQKVTDEFLSALVKAKKLPFKTTSKIGVAKNKTILCHGIIEDAANAGAIIEAYWNK